MAKIINLRQARKAKARSHKADRAAEQRAKHGETKASKDRRSQLRTLEAARLDGHSAPADGTDANRIDPANNAGADKEP